MKAFLISKHGFKEPESHAEIRAYYRENKHIMKADAYRDYNTLNTYSNSSRYKGIAPDRATWMALREKEYKNAKVVLEHFRRYLRSRGMDV